MTAGTSAALTLPAATLLTMTDGWTHGARPHTAAAYRLHTEATRAYCQARAHDAATLVRALWPDAATLTFDLGYDPHGLLWVRDSAGKVLWFNRNEITPEDHEEAARYVAAHGFPPKLDLLTAQTIGGAISDAAAADSDFFPRAHDDVHPFEEMWEIDIAAALAVPQLVPYISFTMLAGLLEQHSEVQDVPAVIDMLREQLATWLGVTAQLGDSTSPQRPMLIWAKGDSEYPAYVRADASPAEVVVYVSGTQDRPADCETDRLIGLAVDGDGEWTVYTRRSEEAPAVVLAGGKIAKAAAGTPDDQEKAV